MSATKATLTLILCTMLFGCKDIINPNTPIAQTTPFSVTGNWAVYNVNFQKGLTITQINGIGGPITQTGNSLTAGFHINTPCFGNGETPVPLTGSITSGNQFSLNSSIVNGETVNISGTFTNDGATFNLGYVGINGPCTGNLTSLTGDNLGDIQNPRGTQIPTLSGDWSFFPGFPGPSLSEKLIETPTPDADGRFALAGTATITGSPCFTSGTLQPGSYISGSLGEQIILLNDGSTYTSPIVLYYQQTPAKPTLQLYPGTVTGGNCNGSYNVDLQ